MTIRIIAVTMIIIIAPPPIAHAQMMLKFKVSGEFGSMQLVVFSDVFVKQVGATVYTVPGELGFMQSSSINDSTFVGQVGSTLYTVPVTVIDDPLLTHSENNVTKSLAILVPTGLV